MAKPEDYDLVVLGSGEYVRLDATADAETVTVEGTHLLAAGGRVPSTDGIGLEAAGVEFDGSGHVKVNERLQASAPGSGLSGIVRAARTSRTSPTTTFASSATTSQA